MIAQTPLFFYHLSIEQIRHLHHRLHKLQTKFGGQTSNPKEKLTVQQPVPTIYRERLSSLFFANEPR